MYCQKCRTPLTLDSSLESLNPAAYDLLVATASQTPHRAKPPSRPENTPDADRRALFDVVSKASGPAAFKRQNGADQHDGPLKDTSAMSFVLLSESTVAPAGAGLGLGRGRAAGALATTAAASAVKRAEDMSRYDGGAGSSDDDDLAGDSNHNKAQGLERITKLFEILSARSDIDHPVCVECTEILAEGLQRRLEAANRERDAYVAFLKEAQANVPSDEELQAQDEALAQARREEAAAMAELLRLEQERAALDQDLLALEAQARELDRDEEVFWRERNAFAAQLADFQNERDSINAKYDHDARLLERLQRSNVYNDTFCISHDGTFATINGLRLGRLSTRPVDWPEINAAWGHALLLLVTVADKLGYRFENYEPLPMGSTSRIIRYDMPSPSSSSRLADPSPQHRQQHQQQPPRRTISPPPPAPKKHVLELYSSGDMPLGLTFMHRRFDNAMVAFLELVRQLGVFVHQQTLARDDHPLSLPYRIEGDRIGDVSIKLGIAQDDGWTKACKLTLTCCKFLLAHASNVNSAPARGP